MGDELNSTATNRSEPYVPPPLSADDLTTRVALATPRDNCKGMFFNGVLQAVETLVGASAKARCLSVTGEKSFIDFFNYPIALFLPMSYCATEALQQTSGGWANAFRRLGKQATSDFLATTVGKTLLMLTGSDPRRLLSAMPSVMKTSVSYGERSVVFRGANACTFVVKRDFMPHPYHEGVLTAAVESVAARQVKVEGIRTGVLDVDYQISWE